MREGSPRSRVAGMQSYFFTLADAIGEWLRGEEIYLCNFSGEDSDFVRFNRNRVRQAGAVTQRFLTLDLIEGRRHAASTVSLSGDLDTDRARLKGVVLQLREVRRHLPEDPHLLYATEVRGSERRHGGTLPDGSEAVAEIQRAGHGRDLVGCYAAGASHAGFANSFGQRNWHTSESFNFDWSFFHEGDKAVKAAYAGFAWDAERFARKVAAASAQLEVLARPARTITPGRYRAYLAPAALYEILTLLSWGGFGLRAHRTKTTPLLKMIEEGRRLHSSVHLAENTRDGFAPDFQEAGFLRPEQVSLIRNGVYDQCLVSPRSAREYGAATNGASDTEAPHSIDMGMGKIPSADVLRELGTGIYISNLWYLNFSDRSACRITGMTRFATLWVENGAIQAPVDPMRFDETIYNMLGENLIGLTAERETILDPSTYSQRSADSARLPGALVEDLIFTL